MFTRWRARCVFLSAVIALAVLEGRAQTPLGTAFTYQGQLKDGGSAADGVFDFRFRPYDAPVGGAQVGSESCADNVSVVDGVFLVAVDFGTFTAEERFLEIDVRADTGLNCQNHPQDWVTLSPRQPLTATPYALFARATAAPLHLSASDNSDPTILGINTFTAGIAPGVRGQSNSSNGRGVYGLSTATSGINYGVYGQSDSASGRGMEGIAFARSGTAIGVRGRSESTSGRGVEGIATAATGGTFGVRGESASSAGTGVLGEATATSGFAWGVWGESVCPFAGGVFGRATAVTGTNQGVLGVSFSADGRGVEGAAYADTGTAFGVRGESRSTEGCGIEGIAIAGNGTTYGVRGTVASPDGYAGYFIGGRNYFAGNVGIGDTSPAAPLQITTDDGGLQHCGILVENNRPSSIAYGIRAVTDSTLGHAVYGESRASSGPTRGVWGQVSSPDGYAAYFLGPPLSQNYFERYVGIGVLDPQFQIHLSLNSAGKPTSNTWTISSDARLKQDVKTIRGALGRLLALRGVTYRWIDPASQGGMDGTYTGMIAQEVEKVFPEWIGQNSDGFKTLTVIGFEGLVVEALRELRAEREAELGLRDAQIAELRAENEAARRRADEQQRRIDALEAAFELRRK